MRLDLALIQNYPGTSRRQARAAIEKGQVSVAGETVLNAGRAVAETARIVWDRNRRARPRARLTLPILHQDDDLLIVDKPAGLLSVPTSPEAAQEEDTALARVQDFARRLRPRGAYAAAVHRLDRETSGALAFALSRPAHETLRRAFAAHRIERVYLALVEHQPRRESGVIDLPISDRYVSGRRGVAAGAGGGLPALTRWRVVEPLAGAALVEVTLETGRQHQIRAHLAHIGHPILGERVYRPEGRAGPTVRAVRTMLHAAVLGLAHPVHGQTVRVQSPLPVDFLAALEQLRGRARRP